MRKIIFFFLFLCLVLPGVFAASSSSGQKKVAVKSYTRKNGTAVSAHTRSAPKTKTAAVKIKTIKPKTVKLKTAKVKTTTAKKSASSKIECVSCPRDSNGKIVRSEKSIADFKKLHPCPANGKTSGNCKGYVIDHIVPLAKGGNDLPSNMQWQTVAEAKAKDIIERK